MMHAPSIWSGERHGWALCRSYLLTLVESLDVELEDATGVRSSGRVHWALGVLPGGEHEVPGSWPDGILWDHWLEGLTHRGVERIRFLVAGGLVVADQVVHAEHRSEIAWQPSSVLWGPESDPAVRPDARDGVAEVRTANFDCQTPMTRRDVGLRTRSGLGGDRHGCAH